MNGVVPPNHLIKVIDGPPNSVVLQYSIDGVDARVNYCKINSDCYGMQSD
jgi:hypothetical protein